jgi:hypothetical protein
MELSSVINVDTGNKRKIQHLLDSTDKVKFPDKYNVTLSWHAMPDHHFHIGGLKFVVVPIFPRSELF